MKIIEFNFKMLNGILATGQNLYRWKKIESELCFYCESSIHDTKHLLLDCRHNDKIWTVLEMIFDTQLSWKDIVLGTTNKDVNAIISLISFIIYKKHVIDREDIGSRNIKLRQFMKKELIRRGESYVNTKVLRNLNILIQKLLANM